MTDDPKRPPPPIKEGGDKDVSTDASPPAPVREGGMIGEGEPRRENEREGGMGGEG